MRKDEMLEVANDVLVDLEKIEDDLLYLAVNLNESDANICKKLIKNLQELKIYKKSGVH